jgi:hypothetical protein
MEKKYFIYLAGVIVISLAMFSCKPLMVKYAPQNIPPTVVFPQKVGLSLILPPPLYIQENKFKTISRPISQYFEIAIPPCVDMTGKADNLRSSLADQFYTALFETKRFTLLDRNEMQAIQNRVDDNKTVSKNKKDSTETIQYNNLNQKLEENKNYKAVLDILKKQTDGLMLIYITSDSKSMTGSIGTVGIDYRIVTSDDKVIYAGSKELKYKYTQNTNALEFIREDINNVANTIKEKFPNPDFQDNLKVINKRGNIITVNAGKDQNISIGMVGYVIKIDTDPFGNKLISYRAKFAVREVFPGTFNAQLISDMAEDEEILGTININEPIKMK